MSRQTAVSSHIGREIFEYKIFICKTESHFFPSGKVVNEVGKDYLKLSGRSLFWDN